MYIELTKINGEIQSRHQKINNNPVTIIDRRKLVDKHNIYLDKYMEIRAIRLQTFLGKEFDINLFYNSQDKDYLLYKLSNDQAKTIWDSIKFDTKYRALRGLHFRTNPFCLDALNRCTTVEEYLNFTCQNCRYTLHHNRCSFDCSDMNQIRKLFESKFPNEDMEALLNDKIFSNEFYKDLIKTIENGEV